MTHTLLPPQAYTLPPQGLMLQGEPRAGVQTFTWHSISVAQLMHLNVTIFRVES